MSPRTVYALEVEGVQPQRATRTVIALALGRKVGDIFPLNELSPAGEPGSTKTAGAGGGQRAQA